MEGVVPRVLRNSEGTSVDPVPFIVVTGLSFMGCYSFFPVYFLSFGLSVPVAVVVTTGIFGALAAGAYSRLVWNARPEIRDEVPAGLRLETFIYYALAAAGVLLLLTFVHMAQ
jgi:hypothetical protein